MDTTWNSIPVVTDRFLRQQNKYLFIYLFFLTFRKNPMEGRERRPNFVIFVVGSALIVGGWVMVAWSKSLL